MPIRRRDDGEIVEEPTAPAKKPRSSDPEDPPTDTMKSPAQGTDSLFEPKPRDAVGGRLEDPTVPIDVHRSADSPTRIVSPHRTKSDPSVEQNEPTDPMRDPPVGWLIVVRGPGQGNVITLGNGLNVLGRGPGARARIDFGDDTIARANHARLVYEPRQRRYHLNHGDGSNLTYLNGEIVMGTVEIESGAMIEVGETTLRFQAFCSPDFDWPDLDD